MIHDSKFMLTYKTKKHILKTETAEGVETLGASSAAVSTTETVAAGDKPELFSTPPALSELFLLEMLLS